MNTIEQAKKNIINNYKANYTNDNQSTIDVEKFLSNALYQFENVVRRNCIYDRDKQDEAVKNLFRDYIISIIDTYKIKNQPLCEQNVLLETIKRRIK